MTSCPETMGWEFWWFLKKAVSWFLNLGEASLAGYYGMRRAFFESVQLGSWVKDDVGTVSIVKIVCLSPRVEKLKVKKINKRFVPELKKVVSVSGFLCIWTFYIESFWPYVTQGHTIGAPDENRTYSWKFASRACYQLHHSWHPVKGYFH